MEAAICNELEDIRGELEQVKVELHQSLNGACDDQITELQEAKLEFKKQREEICVKSAELCGLQRICEELKFSLAEKELIIRQLTSENEKARADWEEKLTCLEGVNRELVLAMEGVLAEKKELEDKLCARNEQNNGLKALLLATENNFSEAEKKTHTSDEFCCNDEILARLEDEFENVQDKLNWKNEQFNRLEEAHEKLRSEFQASKLEYEKDRLELIGKTSSLQSNLDSQTRISNCLQTKLQMCEQVLTHEESKRKLVEIQLSESQALFENIYSKCQEEQAKIGQLTSQKDEEIAKLKYLLATKDILFKDMEFENLQLKQHKEDINLKDAESFRSLTKLQEKLQNLEQVHGSCSKNLELRKIEWTSELEILKAEAKKHLSELKCKEIEIHDLRKEFEECKFSLQILNEEKTFIIFVLKSAYSEAYSELLGEHENSQNQIFMLTSDLENNKNMLHESQSKQRQSEEHVMEKLRNLEQVHGRCSKNLELREIEWTSELEILKAEAKKHMSELKCKEIETHALRKELEDCQFSLQILNEEKTFTVIVLKSAYSEAYSVLLGEHENSQKQIFMLTSDLENNKNMLQELQSKQRQLEEHVLEIRRVNKAEQAEITHERNLINAELQEWKNEAGILKSSFEEAHENHKQAETLLELQLENEQACKQEIENLKNLVKEHERNMDALHLQVTSLESAVALKDDTLEALELKNKSSIGMIEELETKNMYLNDQMSGLVLGWQNILGEMEGASNQLYEICCQDESLLEAFSYTEFASVKNEQEQFNEISKHDEKDEADSLSPNAAKLQMNTYERLPFQEINY